MRTFILQWKPSISSYKMEDFVNDLHYLEYGEFSWNVFDWQRARSGDNFYMIKCSEGCTGIVMKGFFTSEPHEANDWSGRSRQVHYMDFRPTYMIHPDMAPLLSTAELEKAMPGFEWNGGHSGRELPTELVPILNGMWNEYVAGLDAMIFDCIHADRNLIPQAGIDEAVGIAAKAFADMKDEDGNPMILKSLSRGLAGKSELEKICGFLDGVIETGAYNAGALREEGFSEEIADILMIGK